METMARVTNIENNGEILSYIKYNISEYLSCLRQFNSISDIAILQQEHETINTLMAGLSKDEQQKYSWIGYVFEEIYKRIASNQIENFSRTLGKYVECIKSTNPNELSSYCESDIESIMSVYNLLPISDQQLSWYIIGELGKPSKRKALHM